MRLFYSTTALLFLSILVPVIAFGQASLKGTITDATTNETLIGANVIVQGTSLGAATNIEGQFRIVGIPEQLFTLKVSYIGYEPQLIEIDFSKTKDVSLNLQLKPTIIEGREVVVTAQMRGQLAAINQQITSNTIVNVVSEEKIKELPDANAAEAIGRLPGVSLKRSGGEASQVVLRGLSSKFSNITVDGVRIPATDQNTRDVDLSMISQGSLAGIELFKTLTPDQDADAIAGAVNLVTRNAPTEREIRLDLKGGYDHLMKSTKQYEFSAMYAGRFFDDILGIRIQGNAESKIRSRENTNTGYYPFQSVGYDTTHPTSNLNDEYLINSFTAAFTDETRTRKGGQLIFDICTPDSGSVKISGLYSSTERNTMVNNRVYPGPNGPSWDYNYRYTETELNTLNTSVQGNNFLLGLDIGWSLSYAQSKNNNPYDYLMTFNEADGAATAIQSGRDHPELYIIPFARNDFSVAACSTAQYFKQENFDKERTAFFNVSKKYTLTDMISGEVKVGAKYKMRDRWMNSSELDNNTQLDGFMPNNVDGSAKNLLGTRFEDFFLHRSSPGRPVLSDFIDYPVTSRDLLGLYRMTPLISPDAIKLWYTLNKNGKAGYEEYKSSDQATLTDYFVTESVSSGYLMNKLNIGQSIAVLLGVRVEKEVNDYAAKYAPGGMSNIGIRITSSEPIQDTTTRFTETIWLPNMQVTLKPTEYLTVRLAGYRALARPDYNLRLPQFALGTGTTSPVFMGNLSLRDAKAWNYEVNTQVYSNTIGLISLSAFYKRIQDLNHEMTNITLNTGLDSLYRAIGLTWQENERFKNLLDRSSVHQLNVGYNAPGPSYAWGLEFEHQMNFNFLPGYLQYFILSYNISMTRSETYIIRAANKVRVDSTYNPRFGWVVSSTNYTIAENVKTKTEGQPKLYGNVTLGYDIWGFSARISLFFNDEYTQTYSTDGQTDVVVDSFTKWDLALKQKISNTVSVFLNINNLTNKAEETSRVNNPMGFHMIRTQELYGTTADLGVRISL
jgi:TonB-dependent receptor